MKNIKLALIALVTICSVGMMTPAFAACSSTKDCVNSGLNAAGGGSSSTTSVGTIIKNIVNVLLYILGAVAVVMIIIGGIRYTTSMGDSSSVKAAKDTILYAVIGLIIAIFAYAIVNFVVSNL